MNLQDIEVTPTTPPETPRTLNFTVREHIPGREDMSDPYWIEYKKLEESTRCFETDIADQCLTHHACYVADLVKKNPELEGYNLSSYHVLEWLNGQPWNNLALNYVLGLKPRAIRVTTGMMACDAMLDRITVILADDGRTIRSITFCVQTPSIGATHAANMGGKFYKQSGRRVPSF